MQRPLNFWLVLVIIICGVSFWFGKGAILPEVRHNPVADTDGFTDDFSDQDIVSNVHLMILNGTEETGLARDFSLIVSRIGCVAQGTGNAPSKPWTTSLLVNRRLSNERAAQLAEQLGGIRIIREFDGRASEDAVLVLGQDHARIREVLHPRHLITTQNR